ncbi:dTMP kinase [Ehrlichia canis]|uniref:Thymidylate kinase n=1 Tax=Ehrlichia canis (strain Jake) TaxID=269484 RepID=KTHY_EHRCJ|nr:dTMP kinase [Ehrlichia canis]Q3YR44.1 RecName: Full=Thymidylate kinase; AltName: Full=dTMP kinase [Ehrlichia canis str. Jake]AAZ68811.1 thymidylate kinase [Ehrlichia canis str. Jake]AUO54460.1 dTMP kinase [Ehrlichia canis]UKC53572.1 dTMP kinase [Ehrlichia canis]UKC54510.1 dTMP kinase [Ehrlichia canis]UKC55446.1 dTMP kinase [Ehrlichia canis]
MFITFEGIDGSGKTTQSHLLTEYLSKIYGVNNVVLTREPGGTLLNEAVRDLLFQAKGLDSLSELLFFIAMRREHFMKVIKPSLMQKKIVVCDRFIDSTIAYQGYGQGIDCNLICQLNDLVVDMYPDITFVIDVDVHESLSRSCKNGYEFAELEFYYRVRNGFYSIVEKNPHRCHIITDNNEICDIDGINLIHLKIVKVLQMV